MKLFDRIQPSEKRAVRPSLFTIPEIQNLLAPWLITKCLAGVSFKPNEALEAIPEFRSRGLVKANVLGDAMGHRGYKLHRAENNQIEGSYDNAVLVLQHHKDHEALAQKVGMVSAQEMMLAVVKLGWQDFDEEEKAEAVEGLGFDDVDALMAAFKS